MSGVMRERCQEAGEREGSRERVGHGQERARTCSACVSASRPKAATVPQRAPRGMLREHPNLQGPLGMCVEIIS